MAEIRVLGAAELKQVLLLDDVLAGVQQAYLAKAQGKAETFPLVFTIFHPRRRIWISNPAIWAARACSA